MVFGISEDARAYHEAIGKASQADEQVLRCVRESGGGMSRSELKLKVRRIKPEHLDEILGRLIRDGKITVSMVPTKGRSYVRIEATRAS